MRANHTLQRLHVEAGLADGARIVADESQFTYLARVLRLAEGAEILLFNGRDGEWRAHLSYASKKLLHLVCDRQERPQTPASDLVCLFAPIKAGRMDYMVQKAVEMGAGRLVPVMTQHVQGRAPETRKIRAHAIEAAEQCGILSLPDIAEPARLADLLATWSNDRRILFCDEDAGGGNPITVLAGLTDRRFALLIGPEGGFSEAERSLLRSLPFVTQIPLGPRILRADTAMVAALAVIQATLGDWRTAQS